MYYDDLSEKLNKRNNRRIKYNNNTYISKNGNDINITLHDTDVVTLKNNGDIVLNSGGWRTVTTKDRINKILYDAKINDYISQKNGVWYIGDYRFNDGMTIKKNGKIIGTNKNDNDKKDKNIKLQVKKYAELYADNLPLALPNNADCWYCAFKVVNSDKTWGDIAGNEHLKSHIKEKYVVPSLAYNALKENYNAPLAFAQVFENTGWDGNRDFGKEAIKKAVYKYVIKRFGYAT